MKVRVIVFVLLFVSSVFAETYSYFIEKNVISSEPIYGTVKTSIPHKECWDEQVVVRHNNVVTSFVGSLLGAVVGHQFGGGDGKIITTIIGADIGSDVAKNMASNEYKTIRKCRTVYSSKEEYEIIGYKNYYIYNGQKMYKITKTPVDKVRVKITISDWYHFWVVSFFKKTT